MARPKKNNADYFSHDTKMRDDPKIKYIRTLYGLQGYAVYCMLLEYLADCDFFESPFDDMTKILLAGDIGLKLEEFSAMMETFFQVNLFENKDGKFYSNGLKKRLEKVQEKRVKMQAKYAKNDEDEKGVSESFWRRNDSFWRRNPQSTKVSDAETPISDAESTQSKVKQSKVNKKIKQKKDENFELFWNKYPKKMKYQETLDVWNELTEEERILVLKTIEDHNRHWKRQKTELKFIPYPNNWLENKRWMDEIKTPQEKRNEEVTTLLNEQDKRRKIEQEKLDAENKKVFAFFENLEAEEKMKIQKKSEENARIFFPKARWKVLETFLKNKIIELTKQFYFNS